MKTKPSDLLQKNVEEMSPYPPSFIDRFMQFIQRLPIPYLLTYLVLFILQSLIHHIVDWVDGSLPAYTFRLLILLYPLWIWSPLAIMTYLDSTSLKALSTFSPLLDIPPEMLQRLKYEIKTMPARNMIISVSFWTGIYVIFTYIIYIPVYGALRLGTLGLIYNILEGWVSMLIGGAIAYHTIRQLRLVHRTVKLVKQFDLFELDLVYAFSILTSRTGVAWILLPSLTLLIVPIQLSPVPILVLLLLIEGVLLALAMFALPLWVMHQRLVAEKRKLFAEHDKRIKSTLARLHHSTDGQDLSEVDQLNSLLEGLSTEGRILEKIRTWPWSTETLSGFLSAIVLPIILLLIQITIQKWLNL